MLAEIEKGAAVAPFYVTGEVGCYRFLPAFFFPPLAFFAIVSYPPLHLGFVRRSRHHLVAAAWHAHPRPAPSASALSVTCLVAQLSWTRKSEVDASLGVG